VGSVIPRVGTAFLAASGTLVAAGAAGGDGDAICAVGETASPHPASTMSSANAANGMGVRRRRQYMEIPFGMRIKDLLVLKTREYKKKDD